MTMNPNLNLCFECTVDGNTRFTINIIMLSNAAGGSPIRSSPATMFGAGLSRRFRQKPELAGFGMSR